MKYAVVLGSFGLGLIVAAIRWSPTGLLLTWPGLSFLLVALGYAALGAQVFGKRTDGSVRPVLRAVLFPYLLLIEALWWVQRRISKERSCHEVAPGLWLGAWPAGGLPPGITLVVDLAAELRKPRVFPTGCEYLGLPCLDATPPEWPAFCQAVQRIVTHPGPVYVHCALGHGRSATVVTAALLARGLASHPLEAEQLVRAARPGVGLTGGQRTLLQRFAAEALGGASGHGSSTAGARDVG